MVDYLVDDGANSRFPRICQEFLMRIRNCPPCVPVCLLRGLQRVRKATVAIPSTFRLAGSAGRNAAGEVQVDLIHCGLGTVVRRRGQQQCRSRCRLKQSNQKSCPSWNGHLRDPASVASEPPLARPRPMPAKRNRKIHGVTMKWSRPIAIRISTSASRKPSPTWTTTHTGRSTEHADGSDTGYRKIP